MDASFIGNGRTSGELGADKDMLRDREAQ